jgi:cation diffusion facilitator CzcD-associated flavoprotein CzcO
MADYLDSPLLGTADSSWRLDAPVHSEKHIRIICIGAGASGLLVAYKLQKHFQNFSLVVYEKNEAVSGTWWENRYPGYESIPPAGGVAALTP